MFDEKTSAKGSMRLVGVRDESALEGTIKSGNKKGSITASTVIDPHTKRERLVLNIDFGKGQQKGELFPSTKYKETSPDYRGTLRIDGTNSILSVRAWWTHDSQGNKSGLNMYMDPPAGGDLPL